MNQDLADIALPPPLSTGAIEAAMVKAFAAASGDLNPIHLSDDIARRAGLDGAILHGLFITARFEAYLEAIPEARLRVLQTRFVRPAPVGVNLIVHGRVLGATTGELHLRLLAKSPAGTLFAVGEARLDRVLSSSSA